MKLALIIFTLMFLILTIYDVIIKIELMELKEKYRNLEKTKKDKYK